MDIVVNGFLKSFNNENPKYLDSICIYVDLYVVWFYASICMYVRFLSVVYLLYLLINLKKSTFGTKVLQGQGELLWWELLVLVIINK